MLKEINIEFINLVKGLMILMKQKNKQYVYTDNGYKPNSCIKK